MWGHASMTRRNAKSNEKKDAVYHDNGYQLVFRITKDATMNSLGAKLRSVIPVFD
jgi:hypothetical protein